MSQPAETSRYAPSLIALHWATALLIVLAYATMELREVFEKGSPPRELMKWVHFSLGLTILILTIVRIAARLTAGPAPEIAPPIAPIMKFGATAVHLALYTLLIALPVFGWLILSSEGKAISFWGLIDMPALVAEDKGAAETYEEIHEILGKVGYLLIGAHAALAILHHLLFKDNTLIRMMPRARTKVV